MHFLQVARPEGGRVGMGGWHAKPLPAGSRAADGALSHPTWCPIDTHLCHLQAADQAGLPRIVSIQNSYSLLVRGPFETDLAEVCAPRQGNVGLLAYSPLAGGESSWGFRGGMAAWDGGQER